MGSATYQRRNTTQRGYGHAHQQLRKRLLPLAIGQPCPRCGRTMLGQADPDPRLRPLDLDHVEQPVSQGGGGRKAIAHRYCNRAHGARLLNALRRARRQAAAAPRRSRAW